MVPDARRDIPPYPQYPERESVPRSNVARVLQRGHSDHGKSLPGREFNQIGGAQQLHVKDWRTRVDRLIAYGKAPLARPRAAHSPVKTMRRPPQRAALIQNRIVPSLTIRRGQVVLLPARRAVADFPGLPTLTKSPTLTKKPNPNQKALSPGLRASIARRQHSLTVSGSP